MKKIIFICSLSTLLTIFLNAQNPLNIPPEISGSEFNLNLQTSSIEFFNGNLTNTIGYNQSILGPTLVLEKGDHVTINVSNNLEEPTTLHWHGLHISAENDGGPHTVIEPGAIWSPAFTVLDHAATYWYHPHLHEQTEAQVTMGAAGLIIVKDAEEAQLDLPRSYGIDDFPIIIQSRAFDAEKQFMSNTALDDELLVNGTLDAYLEAPAQVIRFRILNGSTERVYNLGFQNNMSFYQIGTDGGLLNAPVQLTRLRLAPGERAEVLLDLANLEGQSFHLMSFAAELESGIYGAAQAAVMPIATIPDYSNNTLNGSDFNILQINVMEATSNPVTFIPLSLIENEPYNDAEADANRNLLFQSTQPGPNGMANGPFSINGANFDMGVFNYEIPLDNTEIWTLTNMTAISHPFHIHDIQFYILDIDGNPPPANLQGRKDVVMVPPMGGTVRFITKFEDFADEDTPYMYHCHMLSHEDDGMMGQFIIFDNSTSVYELEEPSVSIYPNPTTDLINLIGIKNSKIDLFNTSGQLMAQRVFEENEAVIALGNYPSGIYFIKISNTNLNYTFKVTKH